MQAIFNPDKKLDIESSAVALGTFDGLHKGHIKLIDELSNSGGLSKIVLTFNNNPQNVSSGADVKYITTLNEKERILAEHGVDIMIAQDFNHEIMNTEAEDFFENYIIKMLRAKKVIVGYNYFFGKNKKGNIDFLKKKCEEAGVLLFVAAPVLEDGEVVSSTAIRSKITKCDFDGAYNMLGRHFSVSGTVVEGNKIGRTIGFPTANMNIDKAMVMPEDGVFITSVSLEGKVYPAVTNVGGKPTIQENYRGIETHIIGYDGDLYGKSITVSFFKRTRGISKFLSVEELKYTINTDKNKAIEFFADKKD